MVTGTTFRGVVSQPSFSKKPFFARFDRLLRAWSSDPAIIGQRLLLKHRLGVLHEGLERVMDLTTHTAAQLELAQVIAQKSSQGSAQEALRAAIFAHGFSYGLAQQFLGAIKTLNGEADTVALRFKGRLSRRQLARRLKKAVKRLKKVPVSLRRGPTPAFKEYDVNQLHVMAQRMVVIGEALQALPALSEKLELMRVKHRFMQRTVQNYKVVANGTHPTAEDRRNLREAMEDEQKVHRALRRADFMQVVARKVAQGVTEKEAKTFAYVSVYQRGVKPSLRAVA